jgi:DNA-binding GntR family transcriptional regulator
MPVPDVVETIQPQLMREEVYLTIKRWIVDGALAPGEKVRDLQLAERLGVSRMPIREALNRLADEGFVEMAANRWTRVSPLNPEDAERIYPIIWSLERLAVRLAGPNLGDRGIDAMARSNARLRAALEAGEGVEASRADAEFHQAYINATGNSELVKILSGLKIKLRRLEIAYFGGSVVASRSIEEHELVIEALRRGDIERAADAVCQNWQQSFDRILDRDPAGSDQGGFNEAWSHGNGQLTPISR